MADIPMKSIQWPGLPDTYTFLQKASTLTDSDAGKAADASVVGEALEQLQAAYEAADEVLDQRIDQLEAEIDTDSGEAPTLVAGTAEQLLSTTGTANPTPYTYRENTSGSDRVTVQQITGGTVAWNQRVQNGDFSAGSISGWNVWGCTAAVADNVATVTINSTGASQGWWQIYRNAGGIVLNHVYYSEARWKVNSGSFTQVYLYAASNGQYAQTVSSPTTDTWYVQRGLMKAAATNTSANIALSGLGTSLSTSDSFSIDYIEQMDLTQMFGSSVADYIYSLETATAGAGVAFFRTMFPESYYPYNAGELVSVQTSGRKTVGVNLFDKSTATIGKFIHGNYTEQNNGQSSHSDYIRVIAGANYTASGFTQVANVWTFIWYDGSKNPIGRLANYTATAPSRSKYVIVNFPTTAIDTVQLNLGTTAAPYEPYNGRTYPLDSTLTLRGVPVLTDGVPAYDGDKYAPDGTVTRRFKTLVLNGTETWVTGSFGSTSAIRVYTNLPDAAVGSMVVNDQGYDGYYTGQRLGTIRVVNNAGTPILDVYADKNVYADANAWTAHLAESPMTIVYELATPTTETAAPYQEVQIAGSTEEFLPPETDTRTVAVPVGSQSLYQTNLRAGLETLLNTDLAHAESIAPVQGSTASTNIASGELLMRDGKLYTATQAIVAGAEIGSTNTTETTLAAQIAALEARIAALEN